MGHRGRETLVANHLRGFVGDVLPSPLRFRCEADPCNIKCRLRGTSRSTESGGRRSHDAEQYNYHADGRQAIFNTIFHFRYSLYGYGVIRTPLTVRFHDCCNSRATYEIL